MTLPVDHGALVLCLAAPQDENKILPLAVQRRDDGVGEGLPALALMGSGATVLDCQAGVQQKNALPCPAFKIAVPGKRQAEIGLKFLVDILKRGRRHDALRHGKAQTVRLSGAVIGVLTKDDHLHVVEGRQLEGPEYLSSRRIDPLAGGFLFTKKSAERLHVRRGELAGKAGLPACLDPHLRRWI